MIGEIFDKVYPLAALTSAPLTDVQTATGAMGGEMKLEVLGKYVLVDHAQKSKSGRPGLARPSSWARR